MAVNRSRSWLFVPGDRPERFDKASSSGTHVVLCDLEDAVSDDNKGAARSHVLDWLTAGGTGWVRVNGTGSRWYADDLSAVAELPREVGVVVPKVESPDEVERVALVVGARPIMALVETARGVSQAVEIAAARHTTRLGFGSIDFANDIGAAHTSDALLHARSILVMASRIGALSGPVDGVTVNLDSVDELTADARFARSLGFAGKFCIHPRQVAHVNEQFGPSAAELEWSREIVLAARASDGGAIRGPGGQMIDRPLVNRAAALLAEVGECHE